MSITEQVPPRDQIDLKYTWNKESVFASAEDWQSEFEAVSNEIDSLSEFEGTLSQNAARLVEWIETSSLFYRRVLKLVFYARMSISVDNNDEQARGMVGQSMGLYGQIETLTAFAEPEILGIDKSTLYTWLNSEPEMAIYRHFIEDLFRKKQHVRSVEVEQVLGMISDPFDAVGETAEILTNNEIPFQDAVDANEERHEINQGTFELIRKGTDRQLRESAWNSYADGYLAFKNTLANNYLTSVKQNVAMAKIRGYDSALEAALAPYNISTEVFHNLINTFKANLPTWHRYWEVKRNALGVETIHPFDLWAPSTMNVPYVDYATAVDWISEGMKPLGEEYVRVMQQGCLEHRWVDVFPNQGKRQGAFSYGSYDTHPFIMMSHDNGLKGMSTLAHELGHSMHSYYTRKHQPYVYSGYSMFVAEVASNFNQALVRAWLFEHNDDPDFQIALIDEAMTNFHRYFFIMPTLARFEYEVHTKVQAGEPLTADILNQTMRDLYAEGYGDTLQDDPERTGITWAQFGHLYVNFYTFQYSTGISAAHALADRILDGEDGAVEDYLNFLKAGNAMYPIDALKMAGVDMATPEAVEKAFGVLSSLVDRLAQLTR